MIYSILLSIFIITMIQYYLLQTNVLWEYLNIISKFSNRPKWNMVVHGVLLIGPASSKKNYILYLNETYNNFYTRLLSCPICIGFWMSIVASIICGNFLTFGIIAYFSLMAFYLIKILTNKSSIL